MSKLQLEVEARKHRIMANDHNVLDELFSVIFVNINFTFNKIEILEYTNLNFAKVDRYMSHNYANKNNFYRIKDCVALMFISKNSLNGLLIKHDRLRERLSMNKNLLDIKKEE